jgi:hypothetical protein
MAQKIIQKGTSYIAIALIALVLIGVVIFILLSLRTAKTPSPPTGGGTGLSLQAVQEAAQKAQQDSAVVKQNYPIANVLPYGGPTRGASFFIPPPKQDGTVRIIINANSDFNQSKEAAINWIKSQGYNPDELKLEYKSWAFPK